MKPKQKKRPKKNRRKSAKRAKRASRRRRNPADGAVSIGSIVAGVVGGGVLAGAADYLLAGQTWSATPTRRAMIDGVATLALGATAAATSGFARGAASGAAGAFGGLTVANLARVIGEASLAKGADKSTQSSTTTPTVTLDQGAMHGLVLPRAAATPRPAPKAKITGHMSAVVLDRSRMRALVVDPTSAMQAARRAGVAPAMLEAPRMMVRPATPGGRMGQLLVRGISR